MKIAILLLTALLIQPALANNLIEDTAILALKAAKHTPTGTTLEHGGMIFSRDSGEWGTLIEYVEPVPGGSAIGVQVINKKLLLPTDELLATYHLHLCMTGYYQQVFSRTDIRVAIISDVPEFMLDECTGDVHEFDPEVDFNEKAKGMDAHLFDKDGGLVILHLPFGRIIGNIGETEEKIHIADHSSDLP